MVRAVLLLLFVFSVECPIFILKQIEFEFVSGSSSKLGFIRILTKTIIYSRRLKPKPSDY